MLELLTTDPEILRAQRLLAGAPPQSEHPSQIPRLLPRPRRRLSGERRASDQPCGIHQRRTILDQHRPNRRDRLLSIVAIGFGNLSHLTLKRLQRHDNTIASSVKNIKNVKFVKALGGQHRRGRQPSRVGTASAIPKLAQCAIWSIQRQRRRSSFAPVMTDRDPDCDEGDDGENQFRSALRAGRFGDARALIDKRLSDANAPQWLVTSMLENPGLSLAHAGHHDESIAAFERALDLGWNVVPDGRCEIARVLLLAGRSAEADVLWRRLRDADPDGVWTLNTGAHAYSQVGRDEEAVEWLAAGLRVAIGRDDPEHVVDQMSDARRVSLRRLGRELDELERDVEAFRARAASRQHERLSELRMTTKRAGIPVRGRSATIAWLTEADLTAARERWPTWVDGLDHDEPYGERRARMERRLRELRADGDGPLVSVTIDLDS